MAKLHGRLIAALRKVWLYSEERREAIQRARIMRGCYECAGCGKVFKAKGLNVDHVKPIGKFVDWNTYIEKLFCSVDNLQCLCVECHKEKTKAEKRSKKV